LAVALARKGDSVVLVDADYGLGQLEILCDRRPTVDLEDVLAGRIAPEDALVAGPEGIRLLAGSHAARMNEAWLVGPATDELVAQVIAELREKKVADWILVDVGSGLTARSQTLATASDAMIVVTSPEQASIAASHALFSHLRRSAGSHLKLVTLVNKASSHRVGDEAADRLIQAARLFQGLSVGHLGVIREDTDVPRAVRNRMAVVQAPGWWLSTAARDIDRITTSVRQDFDRWASASTDMSGPIIDVLRSGSEASTETISAQRKAG
jgi:flagellar biosynthesis protein FlhG